jgi:phage shock protein C
VALAESWRARNDARVSRRDQKPRRDSSEGIIGGVCAGLGEYFDIDTSIIRALFIAAIALSGFGPVLYVTLWILLDDSQPVAPFRVFADEDATTVSTETGPPEDLLLV